MAKTKNTFKNSPTPTELRLIQDLNELKTKRLTTNKFELEMSNIIKDDEKREFSLSAKMRNIQDESYNWYNVRNKRALKC